MERWQDPNVPYHELNDAEKYWRDYDDLTRDTWHGTARQHYEKYGKDEGRVWGGLGEKDLPESIRNASKDYTGRIATALYYELGREPTQEEINTVVQAVDKDPSLLNTWYQDRIRKGLDVPRDWGEGEGLWNPATLIPSVDYDKEIWSGVQEMMNEDFELDLDPDGKWAALEHAITEDALNGYNPEQWASRAATDAAVAHKNQLGAIRRDAARMGINPNSGVFGDAYKDAGLGMARNQASAMNQARISAEEMGKDRRRGLADYGLNAQQLNMQKQTAEEGRKFEALGLGADWLDNKRRNELGWGELGHRFYHTDLNSQLNRDKFQAEQEAGEYGFYGNLAGRIAEPALDKIGEGLAGFLPW